MVPPKKHKGYSNEELNLAFKRWAAHQNPMPQVLKDFLESLPISDKEELWGYLDQNPKASQEMADLIDMVTKEGTPDA